MDSQFNQRISELLLNPHKHSSIEQNKNLQSLIEITLKEDSLKASKTNEQMNNMTQIKFWPMILNSSHMLLNPSDKNDIRSLDQNLFDFFRELNEQYYMNEKFLYEQSSTSEAIDFISNFKENNLERIEKLGKMTSLKILDFILGTDNFLLTLSSILKNFEDSFEFDEKKIKSIFSRQKEIKATKSKSKLRSSFYEDDESDYRKQIN